MDYTPYLIIFAAGFVLGAVLAIIITRVIRPYYRHDLKEITAEIEKKAAELSLTSLQTVGGELVKLADTKLGHQRELGEKELETKKQLIDQTLSDIKTNLKNVEDLVLKLEKDRQGKYSELAARLQESVRQTERLQETAGKLETALVSPKLRGQWGEKMAEDVLRLAGFIEGMNYLKQQVMEGNANRPDYTFLLPQGLKLNMDVKFPMTNYLRCLESESEVDSQSYKNQFLKDARQRVKEVTGREYINPEERTMDYVLVFIPNEQVYRFINENDRTIIDESLKNKVILCSPVTLYAILAIIRQAIDNFKLEKAASEILAYLSAFHKQWDKFVESMDKMGKKIKDAQEEYDRLSTTRHNKLDRLITKIEDIREQQGIPEAPILEEAETVTPQIISSAEGPSRGTQQTGQGEA